PSTRRISAATASLAPGSVMPRARAIDSGDTTTFLALRSADSRRRRSNPKPFVPAATRRSFASTGRTGAARPGSTAESGRQLEAAEERAARSTGVVGRVLWAWRMGRPPISSPDVGFRGDHVAGRFFLGFVLFLSSCVVGRVYQGREIPADAVGT